MRPFGTRDFFGTQMVRPGRRGGRPAQLLRASARATLERAQQAAGSASLRSRRLEAAAARALPERPRTAGMSSAARWIWRRGPHPTTRSTRRTVGGRARGTERHGLRRPLDTPRQPLVTLDALRPLPPVPAATRRQSFGFVPVRATGGRTHRRPARARLPRTGSRGRLRPCGEPPARSAARSRCSRWAAQILDRTPVWNCLAAELKLDVTSGSESPCDLLRGRDPRAAAALHGARVCMSCLRSRGSPGSTRRCGRS